MNEEYKNELISKYRSELFETEDVDLKEIDSLISDEDLRKMIQLNNSEIGMLINERELDRAKVRKLLVANVNFYKLAKKRKLSVPGTSFLMSIAGSVDYDGYKLYDELNVGRYYGIGRTGRK